MNIKRLLIAMPVMSVCVWITDFIIHGIWLSPVYAATKELWRSEDEMISKMPFMFSGQFLVGIAFTLLFALFVAEKRCLKASLTFAGLIGLMTAAAQVIMYAVRPYPGHLIVKWFVAYLIQSLLLGVIVHFVYRPKSGACCQRENT